MLLSLHGIPSVKKLIHYFKVLTKPKDHQNKLKNWSVEKSSELYKIKLWGDKYFFINDEGNISVKPTSGEALSIDIFKLIKELESRNLKSPIVIRFDDILKDRLFELHKSFNKALKDYKYNGLYQGVYPVKCNQQRQVVERLVQFGNEWNFGLEAGSKAELLIALSLIKDPNAIIICNGYKDERYIETAILARQLDKRPIIVIEQPDEVQRIIKAKNHIGSNPILGIRAKLLSNSSGRWSKTNGEKSKFGLSTCEIIKIISELKTEGLLSELKLLHFHIGSQINDIALIKDALQEASQIYVELTRLGAPMGFLDVGGGLGVDYDGSQTASNASKNYSLQNYANDVVATIQECCKNNDVKIPHLLSESGRSISSHFSVLIFNILGISNFPSKINLKSKKESLNVKNLRETLKKIKTLPNDEVLNAPYLQEAWNDAQKFKEDSLTAFRLGYISLTERGKAEELCWGCAKAILEQLKKLDISKVPDELKSIPSTLAVTYHANLSIFQSAPDTWTIEQLFPIMPIHRLKEEPILLGEITDLTCDSDGKINKFIDYGKSKNLLELHHLNEGEKYYLGMFLSGAYQETMGNIHNLFGRTNAVHITITSNDTYQINQVIQGSTKADVLQAKEYSPKELIESFRVDSEEAIKQGKLRIKDAQKLLEHVENSLRESTYLH